MEAIKHTIGYLNLDSIDEATYKEYFKLDYSGSDTNVECDIRTYILVLKCMISGLWMSVFLSCMRKYVMLRS